MMAGHSHIDLMNEQITRGFASELQKTMACNCDLDNWEPESRTGHSCVCRIHKAALKQWLALFNGAPR